MTTFFQSVLCVFLPLLFLSCGASRTEEAPSSDKQLLDSLARTVATAVVVAEDMSEIVKLNGKIMPDEAAQAKVYALVSGRLTGLTTELGDYVPKGKPLAVLQSTEVAGVSNDVSIAQSNAALARKNMESAADLYNGGLATEKDYLNAKMEYNKAQSELSRSRQVASITGGNGRAAYILRAPVSGYIIEKNVTNNSEVRTDNNTALFTIADLSTVWVIANVYESDINRVHMGDSVTVTTLADPARIYTGRIDKLYDVLDAASRTMRVRICMPNKGNELKPEMFARIQVKRKITGQLLLSLPSGAIVLDNSRNYVVIKNSAGAFTVKEVQIIKRMGDKTFVTGVLAGDQVVIDSQVFLVEALRN